LVKFTDEVFGAKLLEAITAGLYDGNLSCLREYVQNCIDSEANRRLFHKTYFWLGVNYFEEKGR
jgi:hypothetical protein